MEKIKLNPNTIIEKKLPHNLEAEQALIGSILINNDLIDEIASFVDSSKFFDPAHKQIFEVIENLNTKGMIANPITLKNYFQNEKGLNEVGGTDYLVKLTRFSSSSRQALDYAKIIHEMYVKRELIFIAENISTDSQDEKALRSGENIIETAEQSLYQLAERGSFSQSYLKFNKALDQTINMATEAIKNDQGIVGVPTGLTDLDEKLGGLHKSDLVIIAGRPSMGKTALATNIAFNAAKKIQDNGEKSAVAFFSLEMSSEQLSTRILSEQTKIQSNDIRRGKATEEQLNKYIEMSRNIYDLPLYIDETPAITISSLSNRARRMKRLFGLNLIVVDYIQLIRSSLSKKNEGRVQEISEITQGLKALAKELKVPVLALSQLSRAVEQRDEKIPQLSDLRESGSIEQDADVVLFVYREEYYLEKKQPKIGSIEYAEWQSKMSEINGLADIIIGKQRHGPTGNIKVEFEGMFTRFKDLSR